MLFFDLLKAGVRADRLTGSGYSAGTIYIPDQAGLRSKLAAAAQRFSVTIRPADRPIGGKALAVTLPRIGLYQSWVPSMDEGWTRFLFDRNGIPYHRLVDAEIRQGSLRSRYDVIILPDNRPPPFSRENLASPAAERIVWRCRVCRRNIREGWETQVRLL